MNNNTYTVGEAVTSYRDAKDKAGQIGILANILCVSEDEVRKLLVENGIDGRTLPPKIKTTNRGRKPAKKTESRTDMDVTMDYLRKLRDKYDRINAERDKVLEKIETLREILTV